MTPNTLTDSTFATRIREAEHAPGHTIMLDWAVDIIESYRAKGRWLFFAILAGFLIGLLLEVLGLPEWLHWIAVIVIATSYYFVVIRRENRVARAFEDRRDAWLDAEKEKRRIHAEHAENVTLPRLRANAADVTRNPDGSLTAGEPYHDPKI